MLKILILDKWDSDIEVKDPGIRQYINLDAKIVQSTQGRHAKKEFGKGKVHIVERLINNLMRGGTGDKVGGKLIRNRRGCGKKAKMYSVTEKAFDIIYERTKQNPVGLLVSAIENAAPREEVTRVRFGGIITPVSVDISPQRRVDFALRNMGKAVAMRSFNNPKSSAEALADEIILASKDDPQSHAISRRIETERVARSSR